MVLSSSQLESSLEFGFAQTAVHDYAAAVAHGYRPETPRVDCDESIEAGIRSFRWLQRAESTLRQAVYDGLLEWNDDFDRALQDLYSLWIESSNRVETLIAEVSKAGGEPGRLQEFREARSLVVDRLERQQWADAARAASIAAFSSETW